MTDEEAIYDFTEDANHEENYRCHPLLAKAFDDIRSTENIPENFARWLIALACPDDGGQQKDAVLVLSSLLAGMLECARTGWSLREDPVDYAEWMRDHIEFVKPIEEQMKLMREAINNLTVTTPTA